MIRLSDATRRGFTLLEIMITIAVLGFAIMPMLLIREQSETRYYQARYANVARELGRELMSEIEFRGIDHDSGQFDGYPGFSWQLEIQEMDLVTGKGETDDQKREREEKEEKKNKGKNNSLYQPADATIGKDGEEEEDEDEVYPVRRVTLTILYPDLTAENDVPAKLVLETILPMLPDEDDEGLNSLPGNNSPFQNK